MQEEIKEEKPAKRFSDEYPSEAQFDAEKVDFDKILNKEITILDVAELTGDYGQFIVVLAQLEDKQIQFASGSQVIVPKLLRVKKDKNFPIIAKIVERKSEESKRKYYDIE